MTPFNWFLKLSAMANSNIKMDFILKPTPAWALTKAIINSGLRPRYYKTFMWLFGNRTMYRLYANGRLVHKITLNEIACNL